MTEQDVWVYELAQNLESWEQIGFQFKGNGELNLSRSIFMIARLLSRKGCDIPAVFVGKPYEDSWWGESPIRVADIEVYFDKYGVDFNHAAIVRELAKLAHRDILYRTERGQYVATKLMKDY